MAAHVCFSAVNTGRPTLFGVNLASETFARDVSKDLRLGVIQAHRACVLAKLRHSMIGHVPDLPEAFSFITTDGFACIAHLSYGLVSLASVTSFPSGALLLFFPKPGCSINYSPSFYVSILSQTVKVLIFSFYKL